MTDALNSIATVLLTYAAHSAVACLVALLIGRVLSRPHDRDIVWKAALVLPFITSTLVILTADAGIARLRIDLARAARLSGVAQLPGRRVMVQVLDENGVQTVIRRMTDPVTATLSVLAIVIALCCVIVASARFVRRRRALARALADRRPVEGLTIDSIQLSVAGELPSPVALPGSEICLPEVVMTEFSARHRETLIAHEVAHIERGDPAWFAAVEIMTALSAFQPLVFLVAREFRRDVELICDEAAMRRTNDREGLISALALLAAPFDPQFSLQGAPTAYDGSPLVARAARIATLRGDVVHSRRNAFLAVAGLLLALGLLPVVSSAPRLEDIDHEMLGMRRVVKGTVHTNDSVLVQMRSRVIFANESR